MFKPIQYFILELATGKTNQIKADYIRRLAPVCQELREWINTLLSCKTSHTALGTAHTHTHTHTRTHTHTHTMIQNGQPSGLQFIRLPSTVYQMDDLDKVIVM